MLIIYRKCGIPATLNTTETAAPELVAPLSHDQYIYMHARADWLYGDAEHIMWQEGEIGVTIIDLRS
jgi:hypothetical protein